MSIEKQLGLDGEGGLLEQAPSRWPSWVERCEPLAAVGEAADLRSWLLVAPPEDRDEVLLSLAMCAASDGGDDLVAAAVLADALTPGTVNAYKRIVEQLRAGGAHGQWSDEGAANGVRDVDALIATQLWIEVRSFTWRRTRKVAANIVSNVEHQVRRQLGLQPPRTVVRARTFPTSVARDLANFGGPTVDAAEELRAFLRWACKEGVIDGVERELLMSLVVEAARQEVNPAARERGGLLCGAVVRAVAEQVSVAPVTVRRRTAKSINALIAAAPRFEMTPDLMAA